MKSRHITAFTTMSNLRGARKLARQLVEEKLVACANLVPLAGSIYSWKGKIHQDKEILLILKTRAACRKSLQKRLKELHPYEVPELIFLPILGGLPAYLAWIQAQTKSS